VVICFLGGERYTSDNPYIQFAQTLEETAIMALALSRGEDPARSLNEESLELKEIAGFETEKLKPEQKYVRGLFSGGTLCYETLLIFERLVGQAYSNIALKPEFKLSGAKGTNGHTLIDLGDDEYTRGRPHPMIDLNLRKEKILAEGADPSTAVVLLDVVLGYGSHKDPAGQLAEVIEKARVEAAKGDRHLCFIASVCGTQGDPQGYSQQVAKLEKAGVIVMCSNAEASRLAARIARQLAEKGGRS
jgi:FdrA protein